MKNGLLLKFQDGHKVQVDALVSADGILGTIRAHVLTAGHVAVKPYSKAEAKLEPNILKDGRQHGWVTDGGIFVDDFIMGGKIAQCIGTSAIRETSGARRTPAGREYFQNPFASGLDGTGTR